MAILGLILFSFSGITFLHSPVSENDTFMYFDVSSSFLTLAGCVWLLLWSLWLKMEVNESHAYFNKMKEHWILIQLPCYNVVLILILSSNCKFLSSLFSGSKKTHKKPLSDFELPVSDEENIDQRLADFFSRDQIVNILGFVDYPVCTTTQLHSFHAVETRKQP